MRVVSVLAALLTLSACATGYHSSGFTGGFSETQLSEDVFTVTFKGNGYTSSERASDFALLRCAEVAEQHGFPFFAIVDAQAGSSLSTYTTPTTTSGSATVVGNTVYATTTTYGGQTYVISKPSAHNTIVGFKEKPTGFSYESSFIVRSLKAKYGITS